MSPIPLCFQAMKVRPPCRDVNSELAARLKAVCTRT